MNLTGMVSVTLFTSHGNHNGCSTACTMHPCRAHVGSVVTCKMLGPPKALSGLVITMALHINISMPREMIKQLMYGCRGNYRRQEMYGKVYGRTDPCMHGHVEGQTC